MHVKTDQLWRIATAVEAAHQTYRAQHLSPGLASELPRLLNDNYFGRLTTTILSGCH